MMVRKQIIRVLFFYGEGGLGKTRLLQEVPNALHNGKYNIKCPDIIDFDDMIFRVTDNLVHVLLEYLPEITGKEKNSLYAELELLYGMERSGDSQKTRNEQGRRIVRQLAQTVNNFSQTDKPILLRFDTIEKIDPDVQDTIALFISLLDKAFVICSGRNESQAIAFQEKLYEYTVLKDHLDTLTLKPFSSAAQKEYLIETEKEYHTKLSQRDVDLLLDLSGGRPILIDLAIEYFSRDPESNFHAKTAPKTIKDTGLFDRSDESKRTLEQEFEHRLVNFVTTISGDMERLIRVLSRVHPLSVQRISYMLKISELKADRLFQEAQTYVFIKSIKGRNGEVFITLHDEMRRMIITHVWTEIDSSFKRRKRDSRRAREMYITEDQRLREHLNELKLLIKKPHSRETYSQYLTLIREREIVTEKRLRHSLYANFSDGFAEWKMLINKVRFGKKYSFVDRLCRLVRPYIVQSEDEVPDIPEGFYLTEQETFNYYFIEARSNQDLGIFGKAENSYLILLHNAKEISNKAQELQITNMLGVLKRDQGQFEDALKYQQRCRSLLSENAHLDIANVENSIGYIYLLQKDCHRKYLKSAQIHFKQARQTAHKANQSANLEQKISIKNLSAAIKNNLGYIFSRNGEFDKAEKYCKDAVEIWEEIGRTVEIAWAKINLGVMARDQRQYQHSIQRLKESIALLADNPHDNFRDLCQAHLQLGWTQWFMAGIDSDQENKLAKLEDARSNLEKSLQFALTHDFNTELPDVYHQLASVYWRLSEEHVPGDLEKTELQKKARETNAKSIKWSENLKNNRYFVDAWVGEMEFDYDINDDSNIEKCVHNLKPYENHGFPLYFGRMERILGDWAYRKGNLDAAFGHYLKGIPLINLHGGYGPYAIEIELTHLANKLKTISIEEAESYLEMLGKAWENDENSSEWRVDLNFWVEEQLDQIQILN